MSEIFSFVVPPRDAELDETSLIGAILEETRTREVVHSLMMRADRECKTKLRFSDGENHSRELLHKMRISPSLKNGKNIALHLHGVTTKRSGSGLLFIGRIDDQEDTLFISRFPADEGIQARIRDGKLLISYITDLFLKNKSLYKLAYITFDNDEYMIRATDKQISDSLQGTSMYWVRDFLGCEFFNDSALSSKKLGKAIVEAQKKTDNEGRKVEIVAAGTLMQNIPRKKVSARKILQQMGLTKETSHLILDCLKQMEADDEFMFDRGSFSQVVKSVELRLTTEIRISGSPNSIEENVQEDGEFYKVRGGLTSKMLRTT